MPEIRPFARSDRDGLTSLVNRHIAAVLPGGAVPVSTLLSQLERDVHEAIVDPWVIDRQTIVAVERDRVVGAAHLKRYGTDARVSESYHDAGEISWLVFEPREPAAVLDAALAVLHRWGVRVWYADGNLPCLGVYGIPDAWPHVIGALVDAGFDDDDGQVELVYAGDISIVDDAGAAPVDGLALERVVGPLGTSFEARLDGERVGVFEVEDAHGIGNAQLARWADEGNHWVLDEHRGRGIGSWLFRSGCSWLRLAGKDRLLAYAVEDDEVDGWTAYYRRFGLVPITRTRRGWRRPPRQG